MFKTSNITNYLYALYYQFLICKIYYFFKESISLENTNL